MKIKRIILTVTFLIFQIVNIRAQNAEVTIPYNTVEIPPNNGSWFLCSKVQTKYASYSVRVVNDTWPLTMPEFGTKQEGYSKPLPTAPKEGIVAQMRYTSSYKFIPSLSCNTNFVTACDQDAGNYFMKDNEIYCLVLINSVSETQRVNVTVSFTNSVFESPFTSDIKPGGHSSASSLEFSFSTTFLLMVFYMLVLEFGSL